jgi:predicted alpha/beta-hydrolase family hydrolase
MKSKTMKNHYILSHGLESGPNASKITHLAGLAEAAGHTSERPDYGRGDISARISQLRAVSDAARIKYPGQPLVLAGSSMGAYISAMVSLEVPTAALFLMAPPVFFRGPAREKPVETAALRMRTPMCSIIHGWRDELIDPIEVVAFARAYLAELILVDDDHRLGASMAQLESAFLALMARVEQVGQLHAN